jgi:pimeloyl-ACP methyl ester carboxylesterase
MKMNTHWSKLTVLLSCLLVPTTLFADTFTVKARPASYGNPAVYVQIHTDTLSNTNPGYGGVVVLTVHGLAHTGNSFVPGAQQLFDHPPTGTRVKKVINLNLPNRGGSGLPFGNPAVKFGNLNVEDYARVLLGTLDYYKSSGDKPTVLIGHSMGGLVIQTSQEQLLAQGKSLRGKYGVTGSVVLASGSPSAVPDPFLESGAGLGLLSFYTQTSPVLGTYISIDPESFLTFFFTTDASSDFAPGTPTIAQLAAAGYKSDESEAAAIQTVGLAAMRPTVRSGAFAPWRGTTLYVMVGNHDPFNDPAQHANLYQYLTGDSSLGNFIVINDPYAVHDQLITDPSAIVNAF